MVEGRECECVGEQVGGWVPEEMHRQVCTNVHGPDSPGVSAPVQPCREIAREGRFVLPQLFLLSKG